MHGRCDSGAVLVALLPEARSYRASGSSIARLTASAMAR